MSTHSNSFTGKRCTTLWGDTLNCFSICQTGQTDFLSTCLINLTFILFFFLKKPLFFTSLVSLCKCGKPVQQQCTLDLHIHTHIHKQWGMNSVVQRLKRIKTNEEQTLKQIYGLLDLRLLVNKPHLLSTECHSFQHPSSRRAPKLHRPLPAD